MLRLVRFVRRADKWRSSIASLSARGWKRLGSFCLDEGRSISAYFKAPDDAAWATTEYAFISMIFDALSPVRRRAWPSGGSRRSRLDDSCARRPRIERDASVIDLPHDLGRADAQ